MGKFFSKPQRQPQHPTGPPVIPLMELGWREISWGNNKDMKQKLFKIPREPSFKHFRILVVGPISAGKSSFISSIESIVQNKKINAACKVSAGDKSFTKTYTTQKFKDENGRHLPFVIGDIMGLESGGDRGVRPLDIMNTLEGHIKEGYKFNPVNPCSQVDSGYIRQPTLYDRCHCLVFVISIDQFVETGNEAQCRLPSDLMEKIQNIREQASALKIPHVVILTKVDLVCPRVQEDIKRIYRSPVIQSKVEACGKTLGIPKNCLFPIRNYSDEMELNPDMDAVLLYTLLKILDAANDFVEQVIEENEEADEGAKGHSMDQPLKF